MRTYKSFLLMASALCLASCQEDVFEVDGGTTDKVEKITLPKAQLRNASGSAYFTTVEAFTADTTIGLHLELNKAAKSGISGTLAYGEASTIEQYNATYGTSYKVFPSANVSFGDPAVVMPGEKISTDADITITIDDSILASENYSGGSGDVTYAIPVTVTTDDSNVTLPGEPHIIFVKNRKGITPISATRPYHIFSCMETGTANPLFHLALELESTGEPLFDYVIVFSSALIWNPTEREIQVHPNTCQAALNANYEKFVKPLHDRGIKVIMSLLSTGKDGQGPGTGLTMSCIEEDTAKKVAKMLADYCNTYHLDGIFFDEEYGQRRSDIPGVSSVSSTRLTSRLCYETKMAMPDKEVIAYNYSNTAYLNAVDGVYPKDYIDWVINDYNSWSTGSYEGGMPLSKMTPNSQNCAPGTWNNAATTNTFSNLKNQGWGGYMVYCLDYAISTWNYQKLWLQRLAQNLFNDNLVDTGYRPEPEW